MVDSVSFTCENRKKEKPCSEKPSGPRVSGWSGRFAKRWKRSQRTIHLVLIFEDLHWVDDSTLDLISALARRREPAKLMLLGTYRPADVVLSQTPLKGLKQDLQVHHLCTEIALERLEEPAIADTWRRSFRR